LRRYQGSPNQDIHLDCVIGQEQFKKSIKKCLFDVNVLKEPNVKKSIKKCLFDVNVLKEPNVEEKSEKQTKQPVNKCLFSDLNLLKETNVEEKAEKCAQEETKDITTRFSLDTINEKQFFDHFKKKSRS
jgi:hypothetical protein